MTYEIKTPALKKSVEIAREAARALMAGEIDPCEANARIRCAREMQKAVMADLKAGKFRRDAVSEKD